MIRYRGDAVNIVLYDKKTNKVEITKIGGGCWSFGCCLQSLIRDITCLTDDENGEEIKAEIYNIVNRERI